MSRHPTLRRVQVSTEAYRKHVDRWKNQLMTREVAWKFHLKTFWVGKREGIFSLDGNLHTVWRGFAFQKHDNTVLGSWCVVFTWDKNLVKLYLQDIAKKGLKKFLVELDYCSDYMCSNWYGENTNIIERICLLIRMKIVIHLQF